MASNTDPSIQFFDNFIPKLHAGSYEISVSQTMSHSGAPVGDGPFTSSQKFKVDGPKYQIPAADVHATFPPSNHSGRFEEVLPHVVFNKKALPWERIFDSNPEQVPWIALLAVQIGSGAEATPTVAGGEITAITVNKAGIGYHELPPTVSIIDKGNSGTGAVVTAIVSDTGAITGFTINNAGSGYSADTIVKIGYPGRAGGVVGKANQTGAMNTTVKDVAAPGSDTSGKAILHPKDMDNSDTTPCQAINVAVTAFQNYMPQYDPTASPAVDEVSMLAHVRQVSMHDKAKLRLKDGWCASVMAKRFPVAPTQQVNYAVHVVSLLGLTDYLNSTANFGDSNLIQLISLYSWSFACKPELGESFKQLMMDLLATEEGTGYALRLPSLPISRGGAPAEAAQKAAALVTEGYVPMTYHTRQGEETMALYRSPLTPVLPTNIFQRSVTDIEMTDKGSGYTEPPAVTVSGGGIEPATIAALTSITAGATIKPTAGGEGYLHAPQVKFTNANAKPATATATLGTGGSLSQIQINDGGAGYSSAPTITIQGGGIKPAKATAYLDVAKIAIGDAGSGYSASSPPTVAIEGGGGSGATAKATVGADGTVSVELLTSGQGYTSVPTVSIGAPAGGTAATATVTMKLHEDIQLSSGGFGYTSAPVVTVDTGGITSTVKAIINKGQVTKLQVTDAGQGYTTPPSIEFAGGGFSIAEVTAVVTGGSISSFQIVQSGGPYAFPPEVIISGGSVKEPTAEVTLKSGSVDSIKITDAGEGFTGTTNVELVGGQRPMVAEANIESVVQKLTITTPGSGYTSAPAVTISAPENGTTAKALAQIADGVLTGLVITSPGYGYTSAPTVTIDAPASGTQAKATATIGTQVGSLTIKDPGSGYTYPPTVTIDPPASGTTATARAYFDDPIGSSTGAAIYNKNWGVFDLSYSSAFLNARLLALNSKSFAVNVLQWRKEAHQLVNNLYERLTTADLAALEALSPQELQNYLQEGSGNLTKAFMTKLSGEIGRKLIPKFSQPIKSGSTINGDIPAAPTSGSTYKAIEDLKQLLNHKSIQAELKNLSGFDPSTGTFTNPRFKSICKWLAELALMEKVPFETLVPDERMLPAGSIRFFYIDPNAIEALIDGALSVGTHSSRDTLYYTLMRGVVHDATKTLIHQLRANLLNQTPEAPPYDDQPMTGFLLRSPVVAGWPGLEVKAYKSSIDPEGESESIPLLRMSHISKGLLLCLFDGVPEWVQLDEPSEGLTFGVEDGQIIYLRNLTGDAVGSRIKDGPEDEIVNVSSSIDPTTGKLDLPSLTTMLQSALTGQSQLTPTEVVRIETDGGENYATAPDVTLNGSAVTGLTAQIDGLAGIVVEHGGSGYTEPPTITIADSGGGTGSGAEAFAEVQNGKVTAIQLTNPGENYKTPLVTITANDGGSSAKATALVATGQVTGFSEGPFSFTGTPSPPKVGFSGGTAIPSKTIQTPTATAYLGTLGPADLAVEMVKLPERMIFRNPQND